MPYISPVVEGTLNYPLNNKYPWDRKDMSEPSVSAYSLPVEVIREREYPQLSKGTYLDHAGTTVPAKSTITRFSHALQSTLWGNPHSANDPAHASGAMVDDVRLKALEFLGADPAHFDLIFVANATAAIKLVADSFRDLAERSSRSRRDIEGGFWYGYHAEAHTSLVGVRQLAGRGHRCFETDEEVEEWLDHGAPSQDPRLGLFAYPGQSNLSGRRLPLSWAGRARSRLRDGGHRYTTYTLLDAAGLASTASLAPVFADPGVAPDFTALAFYKIFGFPDLGALVVRRESGHILTLRRYFGGGTVTMISVAGGEGSSWFMSKGESLKHVADDSASKKNGRDMEEPNGFGSHPEKTYNLHEALEDGTPAFHSIIALGEAIEVHRALYTSMDRVSQHTALLARNMVRGMASLRHGRGKGPRLCKIYGEEGFGDPERQGATVAFSVIRANGSFVAYSDVEKMANSQGIYVRSGGICCPGGLANALEYEPWELERARSAGHHCGSHGLSAVHNLPTGVVRASLGAMSTRQDIETFVAFLKETFVEDEGVVTPTKATV